MLPFKFGFDFVAGTSSLIAPGAEQLRFFDDSKPLKVHVEIERFIGRPDRIFP